MLEILNSIDGFIWGPPLMMLLMGTGILMSVRLGLLQVMKLPKALQLIFTARSKGEGDVSSFQALCTALAATVGTGNIVGVATAIKLGVLVLCCGCGSLLSSVWQPNIPKACWLLSIVPMMKTVTLPAVRCTISNRAWAKNLSLWL